MSIPADFTFEKPPEILDFKDKELVKFKIVSVSEFRIEETGVFGIEVDCEVLDASESVAHQGKKIRMGFPFKTKKGTQNPMAYYFLAAMFPDQTDGKFPFQFLEGMSFQAASKRVPSQNSDRHFQNWQGYKLLDDGSNSAQY